MTYDAMVAKVAKKLGTNSYTVKAVLAAVPEILVALRHREQIRTPLGVFRMTRRIPRSVIMPNGREVKIPAEMVVKLKPGGRLRRSP